MKQSGLVIALCLCLWLVSGCETERKANFNIRQRHITIITEPEGATVTQLNLPGQASTNLGTTPIEDQPVIVVTEVTRMKNMPYAKAAELMRRVGNVVVSIKKDGYQPYRGTLKTEAQETVTHRITLHPQLR